MFFLRREKHNGRLQPSNSEALPACITVRRKGFHCGATSLGLPAVTRLLGKGILSLFLLSSLRASRLVSLLFYLFPSISSSPSPTLLLRAALPQLSRMSLATFGFASFRTIGPPIIIANLLLHSFLQPCESYWISLQTVRVLNCALQRRLLSTANLQV